MAFLDINPRYRDFLERNRLTETESLLALPAVIVSGHPDRQVGQVEVGQGPETLRAYLKREHRIPWKCRLANAWAGFGLVSNSRREARILQAMRCSDIGCPEWIAVGEDDKGQAFLLVRALENAVDLRTLLGNDAGLPSRRRRDLARQLGSALA